jgi:Bacterial dnaA protein helix-turn-helix
VSDIGLQLTHRVKPARIPLSKIDAVVSDHLGPARARGNAQPNVLYRHIAMYLGKHVGGWSTTRTGRFYNGRDHSTVCYAIRRIESLRRRDAAVDAVIVRLIELCRQETAEQPIPTANTVMKALSDHRDDSLIEELVDRISDRILSRIQLSPASPDQLPE